MSDSPAAILFDEFGSPITTVSGVDGVRIGVDTSLDMSTLATEATASGSAQTLVSLEGKDFATETTQATLSTSVNQTNGTQVTRVVDQDGTSFLVLDGAAIPVANKHMLVGGAGNVDSKTYHARMVDDTTVSGCKRIMVQSELKPGTAVQIGNFPGGALASVISDWVTLNGAGTVKGMNVDPGGTPDVYTYDADSVDDIIINELRLVMSFSELKFASSGSFGDGASLTNGVLIEVTSGGVTAQLANVKQNEEFLLFPSPSVLLNTSGGEDVFVVSFPLGITLASGTGDNIKVTIRDDISSGAKSLNFFQGAISGARQ